MGGAARRGVVRAINGRTWADDQGAFWPLGATLFWALDGWKHDRDRLKANLSFLQRMGWDYVRILGDVGWPGQEIDSSAPDYDNLLAEFIDNAYEHYGLRTQVTVWGGSSRDPLNAATRVRAVTNNRLERVIFVEGANESFQNGPDNATLDKMVGMFTGGRLIASSCDQGGSWTDDRRRAGENIATAHLDRTDGDEDWRFVRQSWDYAGRSGIWSNNEPKGPRSSVSQTMDEARLCMARLFGIASGFGAYVLHNGAGVTGKVDPAHDRPANLWEVPGIESLMAKIRRCDLLLSPGVENWTKTTQHGGTDRIGPHPLLADAIWSDGADHGVSRNYGAVNGTEFIHFLLGVKHHVKLTALRPVVMEAIDVVSGEVISEGTGTAFGITTGRSDSNLGCIVRGHFV